ENKLKVEPIKLTNLISVTYRASDPHQAAYVLNTLSNLYLETHLAMHRISGAFDFFHQQAEEYRNALEKGEEKLGEFGHKEGIVSPTLTRCLPCGQIRRVSPQGRQRVADIDARNHGAEAQRIRGVATRDSSGDRRDATTNQEARDTTRFTAGPAHHAGAHCRQSSIDGATEIDAVRSATQAQRAVDEI